MALSETAVKGKAVYCVKLAAARSVVCYIVGLFNSSGGLQFLTLSLSLLK